MASSLAHSSATVIVNDVASESAVVPLVGHHHIALSLALVVAAVRGYPDCKKKAQGVFPEINIDVAVKAAESSDGDL